MHPNGPVTHAPYRREPYVRAQLPDGGTIDAKVTAWTRTLVLLHWMDEDGKAWNVWGGCDEGAADPAGRVGVAGPL